MYKKNWRRDKSILFNKDFNQYPIDIIVVLTNLITHNLVRLHIKIHLDYLNKYLCCILINRI